MLTNPAYTLHIDDASYRLHGVIRVASLLGQLETAMANNETVDVDIITPSGPAAAKLKPGNAKVVHITGPAPTNGKPAP